jgi:hypothetical protein
MLLNESDRQTLIDHRKQLLKTTRTFPTLGYDYRSNNASLGPNAYSS